MKNSIVLLLASAFLVCANSLLAAPVVTSVAPTFGPVAGGTIVTITGSGFTGATAVTFGSQPATSFLVNSDTSITATAPSSGAPLTEVPGNFDITVTTPSGTSSVTRADIFTYQGVWYVYAADELTDQVLPFNTATNTFGAPFTVQSNNISVAVTPDGTQACVVSNGAETTTVIDLVTNVVGAPLVVGNNPQHAALTPDGSTLYVPRAGVAEVDAIDVATNTLIGSPIPVGQIPVGIAITPDGTKGYVCNAKSGSTTLSVLDILNNVVTATIPTVLSPQSAVVTPDGTTVYVGTGTSTGAEVIRIDVATDMIVGSPIPIGNGIPAIAITPDGTTVYVTSETAMEVTPIDVATNTAGTPINLGPNFTPASIVISPDSKTAYVGSSDGASGIAVIDLATTGVTFVPSSAAILGLAISPDQSPVASFTTTVGEPGAPTSFDASQSISPVGTIVSYDWDFGDSTSVTTITPTTTHTYAAAGTYTVTLTVTNSAGTSTIQTFTGQEVSNHGGPLATLSQDIVVSSPTPPNPLPPSPVPQFIGKITRKAWGENARHFKLHSTWTKSSSTDVVAYEIYAFNKLLKVVPVTFSLRFTKQLHSDFLCKRHVPKKYKKFLHKKYTIRAVSATGQKSTVTHLRIK